VIGMVGGKPIMGTASHAGSGIEEKHLLAADRTAAELRGFKRAKQLY